MIDNRTPEQVREHQAIGLASLVMIFFALLGLAFLAYWLLSII
jgi:hypothetical protein